MLALLVMTIVYIARTSKESSASARFVGHWEQLEPPEILEQGPGWGDAESAIEWGRQRSEFVLVRLGEGHDSMYSAGRSRLRDRSDQSGRFFAEWPPKPEGRGD
jgi:hypothetical protein